MRKRIKPGKVATAMPTQETKTQENKKSFWGGVIKFFAGNGNTTSTIYNQNSKNLYPYQR